jgi:Family of unknown function (DUF6086)
MKLASRLHYFSRVSELSYVFDREDGSLIWSPSLHTGQLFMTIAESLSRSTSTPTGFEMLAADWCKIHADAFSVFVSNVIVQGWHNRAFRELARGFVVTSIVLLEKLDKGTESQALAGQIGIEDSVLDPLRGAMFHL